MARTKVKAPQIVHVAIALASEYVHSSLILNRRMEMAALWPCDALLHATRLSRRWLLGLPDHEPCAELCRAMDWSDGCECHDAIW